MKINSFKFYPNATLTNQFQSFVIDENGKRIIRQTYCYSNGQTIILDIGKTGFSVQCPQDTKVEPV